MTHVKRARRCKMSQFHVRQLMMQSAKSGNELSLLAAGENWFTNSSYQSKVPIMPY